MSSSRRGQSYMWPLACTGHHARVALSMITPPRTGVIETGSHGSGCCCSGKTRSRRLTLPGVNRAVVVTDHDSRLLVCRLVQAQAGELDEVLNWPLRRAQAAGRARVTVACEPTGTGVALLGAARSVCAIAASRRHAVERPCIAEMTVTPLMMAGYPLPPEPLRGRDRRSLRPSCRDSSIFAQERRVSAWG
jgi:hypothetical protein